LTKVPQALVVLNSFLWRVAPSKEYKERFDQAQKEIASIRPEFKCLGEVEVGQVRFSIENGDIRETKADVVATSDDNRFSTRGGVAKAIVSIAGLTVEHHNRPSAAFGKQTRFASSLCNRRQL
jgi:hypothetical protein